MPPTTREADVTYSRCEPALRPYGGSVSDVVPVRVAGAATRVSAVPVVFVAAADVVDVVSARGEAAEMDAAAVNATTTQVMFMLGYLLSGAVYNRCPK